MSIKKIFDEIANESSTNKKMEILKKYKDNAFLSLILYLANSKRVKFYIKKIPLYTPKPNPESKLEDVIDEVNMIRNRAVTGNNAIELLRQILIDLPADDAYIVERIIEKDCKIGMGTTNMNKIFPGLIEDTPYMGAKPFSPELAQKIFKDGPAYSQIKIDGRYCNAIIRSGDVELESRQGEPTLLEGAEFLKELRSISIDCVLNGELTIDGISRYESNGIIASLVSIGKKKAEGEDVSKEIAKFNKEHMDYEVALNKIRFTVWDVIDVDAYFETKSSIEYYLRFGTLKVMLIEKDIEMVTLIDNREVKTYEEAIQHFQEMLNKGFEGTILKSKKGIWKDGKHNWQVKMKLEMDVDLKIVGFNYGTGKNAKVISSVNAESADGKVFTRPTGIDEKMMAHITENQAQLLGTILEVKCSGLSNDSEGNYSLLHPVFKGFRNGEKTVADTLEDIKKNETMIKGLK